VVSRFFNGLWRDACLVAEFRTGIDQFTRLVEVRAHLFEVLLDHVDIGLIVLVADARVSNNADAELMEAEGHLATLLLPVWVGFAPKESFQIDDGGLFKREFCLVLLGLRRARGLLEF